MVLYDTIPTEPLYDDPYVQLIEMYVVVIEVRIKLLMLIMINTSYWSMNPLSSLSMSWYNSLRSWGTNVLLILYIYTSFSKDMVNKSLKMN